MYALGRTLLIKVPSLPVYSFHSSLLLLFYSLSYPASCHALQRIFQLEPTYSDTQMCTGGFFQLNTTHQTNTRAANAQEVIGGPSNYPGKHSINTAQPNQ